jgi:hypothetical protein
LLDTFVISRPDRRLELTEYDILLSHDATKSFDVSASPVTDLGISIRKMAFLPDWRRGMLLLQVVPYLRAMGEQTYWRQGEDHSILPAYLLALLDYSKGAPAWERSQAYAPALEALASFPTLQEQILVRLRDDARTLPVATTVDLLREAGEVPPSEAYLDVVNDLWARNSGKTTPGIGGRGMIIALVRSLRQKWPDADLDRLAPALRAAAYGKRRPES